MGGFLSKMFSKAALIAAKHLFCLENINAQKFTKVAGLYAFAKFTRSVQIFVQNILAFSSRSRSKNWRSKFRIEIRLSYKERYHNFVCKLKKIMKNVENRSCFTSKIRPKK